MTMDSATRIKILPELIINQIAAGEVVERPASVVKELIDNALDAQADQIMVTVKNGGKDYISIVDNGIGMNEADARLSVERHATSKIYTESDLAKIQTMGFRGEALAAISSVSHFELITCEDEQQGGIRMMIKGGYMEHIGKTGFARGTKITVQNLFYNTPARLKFLKATTTEYQHIQQILLNVALARPSIQFRLTHNQQLQMNTSRGQTLDERIYQLFGEEFQDGLIPVDYQDNYLRLHGFVSSPTACRQTRRWQYLFVNNRTVKCVSFTHGVYDAYQPFLSKGQHPVFFLNLELDPTEIDVNVHPAKTEIRFRNSQLVHTIIADKLRGFLKDGMHRRFFARDRSFIPPMESRQLSMLDEEPEPEDLVLTAPEKKTTRQHPSPKKQVRESDLKNQEPSPEIQKVPAPSKPETIALEETVSAPSKHETITIEETVPSSKDLSENQVRKLLDEHYAIRQHFRVLGQMRNHWIVATTDTSLVVIDPHAAHERIIFEKFRNDFYNKTIEIHSQSIPALIELNSQHAILMDQYLPQFQKLGFQIEPFGGKTFSIHAFPLILPESSMQASILSILEEVSFFGKRNRPEEILETALKNIACHSAISQQQLPVERMEILLDQLSRVDFQIFRLHEQPILIELRQEELMKRFEKEAF
ncbi:MAG: DNA mismatch repair endonuclease MutL [SAR324 cluster bacterium]|nr:DNA mismatch repair endonuclease MutL [SAR324 cluster bacterium]